MASNDPRTVAVRASRTLPEQGEAFLPGPVFAGTYRHAGAIHDGSHSYGRYGNPTWDGYEDAVALLEGGPVVSFASGMAAAVALLSVVIKPGETILIPADGYYTIRGYALADLAAAGVDVRTYLSGEPLPDLTGVTVLWVETPTNPGMDIVDLRNASVRARAAGSLLIVDNTTATPLGQAPLLFGADAVLSSDSKALTGHADLILGHVACASDDLAHRLRRRRSLTGAIPGPMETWLAHRSIATLALRLQAQSANALALAHALNNDPRISRCRYPGLPTDPSHAVAASQMNEYGPVFCFTLEDADTAELWLSRLRLVVPATSFGSVHSTAERRARWGADDVAPGMVRFSAGVEGVDDLLTDVMDALPTR